MTYLLVLQCPRCAIPRVGALGPVVLVPGAYLYVGSARRGLAARLARHGRAAKKRRWHLDYLLDGSTLTLTEIWLSQTWPECDLAARILAQPDSSLPCRGLGASDCRCPGHFFRYSGSLFELRQRLADWGLRPYPSP